MERNHAPCGDAFVIMKCSRPETVELTSALCNYFVKWCICKDTKKKKHKKNTHHNPTEIQNVEKVFSTSETVQV